MSALRLKLGLTALFAATSAPTLSQYPSASELTLEASPIVVRGVSIVDLSEGSISAPSDILISGGKIVQISPAGTLSAPTGAITVDGHNKFALPGLIDVHAHIGEGGALPNSDASRARALSQFLRYGVTTVFVPGATGAGDADWPQLRQRCTSGEISCPDLFGTGSLITAPGSHPVSTIFGMPDDVAAEATESRGVTVLRPGTDIATLVRTKKAAGASAIKIVIEDGPPPWYPKPRLSDDDIRGIVSAAHAETMPVFAHVSSSDQVRIALEAGVDGVMHAPTDLLSPELTTAMAERGMWYVPTFSLYDGILTWALGQREADPYALAGVAPEVIDSLVAPAFLAEAAEDEAGARKYLANARENLRRVSEAGVPIALGSDVNNPFVYPGFSAHEELSFMVSAGLSPAKALSAATAGGAAFLRSDSHLGRITEGFEADLLLLDRNPLERIENSRAISGVISNGKIVSGVISTE
jgi:imidazolonepropionase-like amidohydrolase